MRFPKPFLGRKSCAGKRRSYEARSSSARAAIASRMRWVPIRLFGSSADGKGEEGVDRSFERTGTPLHLGE